MRRGGKDDDYCSRLCMDLKSGRSSGERERTTVIKVGEIGVSYIQITVGGLFLL